jgi:hypothetical protein
MSEETARLPGFWRFVWLFWMQPITLHRLLRNLEVDSEQSGWELLRRRRSPSENWWLVRSAQIFLLITLGAVLSVGLFAEAGKYADWLGVAVGAAVGVAFGVALNLALGVALAGAFLVSVVLGVSPGVAFNLAIRSTLARALLGASGIAFGLVAGSVSAGVVLGVTGGRVPEAKGSIVRTVIVFFTAISRIPVYFFEIIAQMAARYWNSMTGRRSLHWVPVLHHEMSYLPHPFLESHLLAEADADPGLTRRVLDACSIAPGQRRIGRRVEASLQAREMRRLSDANDFQALAELRGLWLPGVQGADPVLLAFSESGRYLTAAQAAFNPHHQLKHLEGFAVQLNAIENQLRASRNALTQPFEEPLEALRRAGQSMRAAAGKNAAGLMPNPFRTENLSGEEGPELFRGRETAVRDIEEIFSDATHAASLQLLAPRRAGKTSLLKMLPRLLPDTVCVFFDLQAHPVASVGAFWNKLAEQALIQAKLYRRAELPKLPDGPPMEAAAEWLAKLDQLPNGRRVLIAIDEFERLQDLFPGSRREFLQLMGLFRATIQHRRGVRLLVSGAAPFDELDGVWDDHFISARQIKLPFLDLPTSVGLLTQPAPGFPSDAIPEDVAHEVYRRTGGQPYLVQVFGSLLVGLLNDEKRKTATAADVQAVEGRAIEWAESYFRDTYKNAPTAAHDALAGLAQGKAAGLTPAARRWLTQRYLLTPGDRLAIPVFGAWVEHHSMV